MGRVLCLGLLNIIDSDCFIVTGINKNEGNFDRIRIK